MYKSCTRIEQNYIFLFNSDCLNQYIVGSYINDTKFSLRLTLKTLKKIYNRYRTNISKDLAYLIGTTRLDPNHGVCCLLSDAAKLPPSPHPVINIRSGMI